VLDDSLSATFSTLSPLEHSGSRQYQSNIVSLKQLLIRFWEVGEVPQTTFTQKSQCLAMLYIPNGTVLKRNWTGNSTIADF